MAFRKTGSATGTVTGVDQPGSDAGMHREAALEWTGDDALGLAEENDAADGSDG